MSSHPSLGEFHFSRGLPFNRLEPVGRDPRYRASSAFFATVYEW
jgi:hypothetical protein